MFMMHVYLFTFVLFRSIEHVLHGKVQQKKKIIMIIVVVVVVVSVLRLDDIVNLICNFFLSLTACKLVKGGPSPG